MAKREINCRQLSKSWHLEWDVGQNKRILYFVWFERLAHV